MKCLDDTVGETPFFGNEATQLSMVDLQNLAFGIKRVQMPLLLCFIQQFKDSLVQESAKHELPDVVQKCRRKSLRRNVDLINLFDGLRNQCGRNGVFPQSVFPKPIPGNGLLQVFTSSHPDNNGKDCASPEPYHGIIDVRDGRASSQSLRSSITHRRRA